MPNSQPSTALFTHRAMTRDAKVVAAWDFDRIIPCHGDVIESTGKEKWLSTFEQFLK
jgi:hypothetical protein